MTEYVQTRDYYLDTIKGLLVVGIVLIHTAFHSGTSYVPNYIRNIVLTFDVPLFFFITGCVTAKHHDINPLKQMYKLILLFFFCVLIYQICCFKLNIQELMQPVFLTGAPTSLLYSINASYWFVPMYIVSLIYAKVIISYFKNFVIYSILILVPVFYIFMYNIECVEKALGQNVQSFLFYLWLILFGFKMYKFKGRKYWRTPLILASIAIILLYLYFPNLIMQEYKFPVKLPYFVLSIISISGMMLIYKDVKNNFFAKIGKNALYYYLSQGIGASIIFSIAKLPVSIWQVKFFLCFLINLTITLFFGYIISLIYPKLEKLFIK